VSVEAISRALNLAPGSGRCRRAAVPACKFVLADLAGHAGPDGTGAFPPAATLVRYTRLSERTVRTCPDRLDAAAIVSPCDPGHRRGPDQAPRPAATGLGPESD
jgi:hypothetical protein